MVSGKILIKYMKRYDMNILYNDIFYDKHLPCSLICDIL